MEKINNFLVGQIVTSDLYCSWHMSRGYAG